MEYPQYLIPAKDDSFLDIHDILKNCSFVRRAKRAGQISDTSGSRVQRDMVLGPEEYGQMKDLSLNLLGEHTVIDCYWNVCAKDTPYHDFWAEGYDGIYPRESDLARYDDTVIGIIFFNFSRPDLPFPLADAGNNCKAIMCHRPTFCNYWHFQLEITLENGDELPKSGNWRKRIFKTALYALIESWAYPSNPQGIDTSLPLLMRNRSKKSA